MVDHSSITLLSLQDHGWPPPNTLLAFPSWNNMQTFWHGDRPRPAGVSKIRNLGEDQLRQPFFVGHIIWWDDLGNLRSWDSWDMMKISTKQISTGVYVLFGRTAFSFHTHLRGFGECFKDWGPISHTKHFKYGWCTKPLKRKGVKL